MNLLKTIKWWTLTKVKLLKENYFVSNQNVSYTLKQNYYLTKIITYTYTRINKTPLLKIFLLQTIKVLHYRNKN